MKKPGQMTPEEIIKYNQQRFGGGQPATPPASLAPAVTRLVHHETVTLTCAACGVLPLSDHASRGAAAHAGETGHQVAVHHSTIDLYGLPRENGDAGA